MAKHGSPWLITDITLGGTVYKVSMHSADPLGPALMRSAADAGDQAPAHREDVYKPDIRAAFPTFFENHQDGLTTGSIRDLVVQGFELFLVDAIAVMEATELREWTCVEMKAGCARVRQLLGGKAGQPPTVTEAAKRTAMDYVIGNLKLLKDNAGKFALAASQPCSSVSAPNPTATPLFINPAVWVAHQALWRPGQTVALMAIRVRWKPAGPSGDTKMTSLMWEPVAAKLPHLVQQPSLPFDFALNGTTATAFDARLKILINGTGTIVDCGYGGWVSRTGPIPPSRPPTATWSSLAPARLGAAGAGAGADGSGGGGGGGSSGSGVDAGAGAGADGSGGGGSGDGPCVAAVPPPTTICREAPVALPPRFPPCANAGPARRGMPAASVHLPRVMPAAPTIYREAPVTLQPCAPPDVQYMPARHRDHVRVVVLPPVAPLPAVVVADAGNGHAGAGAGGGGADGGNAAGGGGVNAAAAARAAAGAGAGAGADGGGADGGNAAGGGGANDGDDPFAGLALDDDGGDGGGGVNAAADGAAAGAGAGADGGNADEDDPFAGLALDGDGGDDGGGVNAGAGAAAGAGAGAGGGHAGAAAAAPAPFLPRTEDIMVIPPSARRRAMLDDAPYSVPVGRKLYSCARRLLVIIDDFTFMILLPFHRLLLRPTACGGSSILNYIDRSKMREVAGRNADKYVENLIAGNLGPEQRRDSCPMELIQPGRWFGADLVRAHGHMRWDDWQVETDAGYGLDPADPGTAEYVELMRTCPPFTRVTANAIAGVWFNPELPETRPVIYREAPPPLVDRVPPPPILLKPVAPGQQDEEKNDKQPAAKRRRTPNGDVPASPPSPSPSPPEPSGPAASDILLIRHVMYVVVLYGARMVIGRMPQDAVSMPLRSRSMIRAYVPGQVVLEVVEDIATLLSVSTIIVPGPQIASRQVMVFRADNERVHLSEPLAWASYVETLRKNVNCGSPAQGHSLPAAASAAMMPARPPPAIQSPARLPPLPRPQPQSSLQIAMSHAQTGSGGVPDAGMPVPFSGARASQPVTPPPLTGTAMVQGATTGSGDGPMRVFQLPAPVPDAVWQLLSRSMTCPLEAVKAAEEKGYAQGQVAGMKSADSGARTVRREADSIWFGVMKFNAKSIHRAHGDGSSAAVAGAAAARGAGDATAAAGAAAAGGVGDATRRRPRPSDDPSDDDDEGPENIWPQQLLSRLTTQQAVSMSKLIKSTAGYESVDDLVAGVRRHGVSELRSELGAAQPRAVTDRWCDLLDAAAAQAAGASAGGGGGGDRD